MLQLHPNWKERYQRWLACPDLDGELIDQLHRMGNDEQAIEDCFARDLSFGTGGMRGVLGPGTNRMNVYTVRKATDGLARSLLAAGVSTQAPLSVVIAYDSRHNSARFAIEAAKVLGRHGLRALVFKQLCPTPLLSFAVRHYAASAGIVITASHNPPDYNGYKVYGADGGQLTDTAANQLTAYIAETADELSIACADEQDLQHRGLLTMIGDELLNTYLQQLSGLRIDAGIAATARSQLRIVFTPLHGTTLKAITRGLRMYGYDQVTVVPEQADPDPAFSRVLTPNPEEREAFALAIQYGQALQADLLLGTDPDGDRLGVAVKDEHGEYVVLTGNQTGALLLHYLLTIKRRADLLTNHSVVVKTVVTSELGRAIAADFGLETLDTLTGFKYIGEKIKQFEQSGSHRFQFGYEESCGYLAYDLVRDKDAVQAALLTADAAAFYKNQGYSLYEALQRLYQQYGYYREELISIALAGKVGPELIPRILDRFRHFKGETIAGRTIVRTEDFLTGVRTDFPSGMLTTIPLPKSNMLKFTLESGAWFGIRPSGTEPKLKLYFGVKGTSSEDSVKQLVQLKASVLAYLPEA